MSITGQSRTSSKAEAVDALVRAALAVLDEHLTPEERAKAEEAYDRIEALRETVK